MVQALFPKGFEQTSQDFTISAYTPSGARAKEFCRPYNGHVIKSLNENENSFDVVVLGFKPQQLNDFEIKKFSERTIIISLLAGVSINKLQERFQNKNIIRLMPNTPAKFGLGITLISAAKEVSLDSLKFWKKFFESTGVSYLCENEDQLDKLTPVTGSGPAYLFEWARIFQEYLKNLNLSDEDSSLFVKNLFLGSSTMLSNDSDDFETLRNKVTSKKGVTYEALEQFKEEGLEDITGKALDRAYNRVVELGRES